MFCLTGRRQQPALVPEEMVAEPGVEPEGQAYETGQEPSFPRQKLWSVRDSNPSHWFAGPSAASITNAPSGWSDSNRRSPAPKQAISHAFYTDQKNVSNCRLAIANLECAGLTAFYQTRENKCSENL